MLLGHLKAMDTGLDLVAVKTKVPAGLDLLHVHNIPFRSMEVLRARNAPRLVAHAHGNLL